MTKLRKFFKNEESYNNLINIYKQLRGDRRNGHMTLFLKAIVACCLSKQRFNASTNSFESISSWMTPDAYFSPHGVPYHSEPFTMDKLQKHYDYYMRNPNNAVIFGKRPHEYIRKIINNEISTN